jgi:YHS domain-containing protein
MSDVTQLIDRIRGEFAANQDRLKQRRQQSVELHYARQHRRQELEQTFDQLQDVWRPRLEALAREFGDRVKVTPVVTPGHRHATMEVKSPLASIKLQFAAGANNDVTELVLTYDLQILPILMEFERHSEFTCPIEAVDSKAIAQWLDDRIVGFVRTYLNLHENQYYLKDQMVEDPVSHIRFPKFAAGATRQREGKTYFFISDEMAAEFEKQQPAKAP